MFFLNTFQTAQQKRTNQRAATTGAAAAAAAVSTSPSLSAATATNTTITTVQPPPTPPTPLRAPAIATATATTTTAMAEPGFNPHAPIVREGWLYKRGEHIKNWRKRYFVLRDDGTLMGYKTKPESQATSTERLNNFTVRGCQIMSVDRPKPYTFIIRGLQWSNSIERMFHVDTEAERGDWIVAIRHVSSRLTAMGETAMSPASESEDGPVDMAMDAEIELSEKFSVQGTSTGRVSGIRKVVSAFLYLDVCFGMGLFGMQSGGRRRAH